MTPAIILLVLFAWVQSVCYVRQYTFKVIGFCPGTKTNAVKVLLVLTLFKPKRVDTGTRWQIPLFYLLLRVCTIFI